MDDGFGLWDVLLSMLWFGLLMSWVWMTIAILGDIFRDRALCYLTPDEYDAAKAKVLA